MKRSKLGLKVHYQNYDKNFNNNLNYIFLLKKQASLHNLQIEARVGKHGGGGCKNLILDIYKKGNGIFRF